jgi:hypothetical protein
MDVHASWSAGQLETQKVFGHGRVRVSVETSKLAFFPLSLKADRRLSQRWLSALTPPRMPPLGSLRRHLAVQSTNLLPICWSMRNPQSPPPAFSTLHSISSASKWRLKEMVGLTCAYRRARALMAETRRRLRASVNGRGPVCCICTKVRTAPPILQARAGCVRLAAKSLVASLACGISDFSGRDVSRLDQTGQPASQPSPPVDQSARQPARSPATRSQR